MTADDPADPRVGEVLDDRYQILERLASGGMGVVYRAERLQLGRMVAIKFLHAGFAQHRDFTKRFEREALTMSKLDHPNCVSVIDFGIADSPYIVMEFVTGKTLDDLIEEGPVPPRRAISISRQLLAGLAHAHNHGIIHRDVKPANIMLSDATATGDHIRILDFGLAKLRDGGDVSMSGIVVGTPSYLSPEQAACKPLDPRADIYATGIVLFELLTGQKPFQADEKFEIIRMHLEADPPALETMCARRFSAELQAAVSKALAKSPADRFPTPVAFMEALDKVPEVTGAKPRPVKVRRRLPSPSEPLPPIPPVAAPAPAPPPEPPPVVPATVRARPVRRFRWLKLGAGMAVVGGVVWLALGRPGVSEVKERTDKAIDQVEEAVGSESEPPPVEVNSVADARGLIAAGRRDEAIRALHKLRRADPHNGDITLLLGNLYAQKQWWSESMVAYEQAVKAERRFGDDRTLYRDVVRALQSERGYSKARALVLGRLRAAAIPHLTRAAETTDDDQLRQRLSKLIAELKQRIPRGPGSTGTDGKRQQ